MKMNWFEHGYCTAFRWRVRRSVNPGVLEMKRLSTYYLVAVAIVSAVFAWLTPRWTNLCDGHLKKSGGEDRPHTRDASAGRAGQSPMEPVLVPVSSLVCPLDFPRRREADRGVERCLIGTASLDV